MKFLDGLVSLITTLSTFIGHVVSTLFSLFDNLQKSLQFVIELIDYLPGFVWGVVSILIAICIARFVLSLGKPE